MDSTVARKRVTCANCGYVFEVFSDLNCICPKCGSNAIDNVNEQNWTCCRIIP